MQGQKIKKKKQKNKTKQKNKKLKIKHQPNKIGKINENPKSRLINFSPYKIKSSI